MKLLLLLSALLYITNAKQSQLRKRKLSGTTEYFECILIEVATEYEKEESTFEHMCQGKDPNGDFDMIYYIDDNNNALPDLDEEGYDIKANSGRYKLVLTHVVKNSDPVITTTPDTDWDIVDLEGLADQGRRLGVKTIGTSTVAIVRVTGNNNLQPNRDATELSNAFFGTNRNTFENQYEECSMGKMIFKPASGEFFRDGVVEINIDEPIINQDIHTLTNRITLAIYNKFKYHLFTKFDHVAYIVPTGTTYGTGGPKGWLAFAYVRQYLSVFNNENAMYLSHQLHEIGHNLGLYHSAHEKEAYGDQSGIMGYGYNMYSAPKMCFNGAKSWQLGWYRDKAIELQDTASSQSIYLSFFGDYDGVPYNSESDVVLIKVGYYHVMYNLRKGINSETQEFANKVTVTYMKNERDLSRSDAALGPGEKFTTIANSQNMVIEFCKTTNIGGVDKAMLSIYPIGATSTCNNFNVGGPVASPTRPPTPPPTSPPTLATTSAPVPDATNRPFASPTRAPTSPPTRAPVPLSTSQPTFPPTNPPTEVPVDITCDTSYQMKIEVKLTTNNNPDQIAWRLKERRGETIDQKNKNSYSEQNREYVHQYCVGKNAIYEFHLKDSSGLQNPGGRYVINVDEETYSEGDIVAEEIDYIQGKCNDANESRLQFILNTGKAPESVSWTLEEVDGDPLYSGGPWDLFAGTSLHFFSNTCLDNSKCYSLTMKSSKKHMHTNKYEGLDGGSYEINWAQDNVKYSTFETGEKEVTRFGNCEDHYYEPSEQEDPKECDCTDEPVGWMVSKGWECEGSHFLTTKCNKNNHWTKNKFCQLSCYNAGNGYPGDVCTCN